MIMQLYSARLQRRPRHTVTVDLFSLCDLFLQNVKCSEKGKTHFKWYRHQVGWLQGRFMNSQVQNVFQTHELLKDIQCRTVYKSEKCPSQVQQISLSRRKQYKWSVHISEYYRSIKKNGLQLKVSTWINLKEWNAENGLCIVWICYIKSEMHNKYTNRLWRRAFVTRCVSSAQVDTYQLQDQGYPR